MRRFIFFVSLLITANPCLGVDTLFQLSGTYPVNENPAVIRAIDLDNDNAIDIAVTCKNSSEVCVLMNNGDGSLQDKTCYQTGHSTSVASADFDRDEYSDLAVTDYYNNCISILLNQGDGSFGDTINYAVGNRPTHISAQDFDNDGDYDLAVSNYSSNNLSVLINNGDGTFLAASNYAAQNGPFWVEIADFDNDNYYDLVVLNIISLTVSVLYNIGNGTFQTAVNYSSGDAPHSLCTGDINNDSFIDIIVSNRIQPGTVSLLHNNGDHTFSNRAIYNVGASPQSVCAADFDNDGNIDLATANNSEASISILINSGIGTFPTYERFEMTASGFGICTEDIDRDGYFDIGIANYEMNAISIFLNQLGNISPVLNSIDPQVTYENELLAFLVTATDIDGIISSITHSELPNGAYFTDNGNGSGDFSWIPSYIQSGEYDIDFYATDDSLAADTESVHITVNNVNRPPVFAEIDSQFVSEGSILDYIILATDLDSDPLALSPGNLPENAIFIDSGNGNGLFSFAPSLNQAGAYEITFIASDGMLADTGIMPVVVSDANPSIQTFLIDNQALLMNLTNHVPQFSWSYVDPLDIKSQTAFEIAVGIDDDWAYAEMWNPAPVASADTFAVYNGSPLVDGQTYYARLRVNNGYAWSDWAELSFRMNTPPEMPTALSPADLAVVESNQPWLTVLNALDAEGDALFYDFQCFDDCLIYAGANIPQTLDSTAWMVDYPLFENGSFAWQARSFDGFEYSDWTVPEIFFVNAFEESPAPFAVTYPPDTSGAQVCDLPATFQWQPSFDADPLDSVHYRLIVALDAGFTFTATYDSIYVLSRAVDLNYGTHYWWKIRAIDTKGNMTESDNVADFLTWVLGDANGDGAPNIGDAIFIINFVFRGGPAPMPLKTGDFNGDCEVNIGDAVYMINFIFRGGAAPMVGCAVEGK